MPMALAKDKIDAQVCLLRGAIENVGIPLSRAAAQLEEAAHSAPNGVFNVSAREIAEKIEKAEALSYARRGDRVLGFMSAHPKLHLRRTGLRLAYVAGTIIDAELRGQDLPLRLLMMASGDAWMPDVIALHTQTPAMARTIERWGDRCFPRRMLGAALHPHLVDDIDQAMAEIGRVVGDPSTGICVNEYPRKMFLGDRLPGLGERDALFMLALVSHEALQWGLACS